MFPLEKGVGGQTLSLGGVCRECTREGRIGRRGGGKRVHVRFGRPRPFVRSTRSSLSHGLATMQGSIESCARNYDCVCCSVVSCLVAAVAAVAAVARWPPRTYVSLKLEEEWTSSSYSSSKKVGRRRSPNEAARLWPSSRDRLSRCMIASYAFEGCGDSLMVLLVGERPSR